MEWTSLRVPARCPSEPCANVCSPMAKPREQEQARRLRARGWSLRGIAAELGVSLSSASVWARGTETPPRRTPASHPPHEQLSTDLLQLRRCGRCDQVLPVTSFNRRGEDYQWWCRDCFRKYFRARGQVHVEQSNAAKARRKRRAQRLVRTHLAAHPCVDCGETDTTVLEFDHLGRKRGDVSALAASGLSVGALREEIKRCEVVCANCHRRRTARRNGSWRLRPYELERKGSLLRTRARNLAFVRDLLLASACVDCGIKDLLVLEFDHMGAKEASISDLVRNGCGMARIQAEIDRCEVRCANCHRRRTRLSRLSRAAKVSAGA
jgi:hypothetical protein